MMDGNNKVRSDLNWGNGDKTSQTRFLRVADSTGPLEPPLRSARARYYSQT